MDIQFNSVSNTKVSVASTTTEVLPANSGRAYTVLVNDSDEAIYLGIGASAVMNEGIRLNSGGGSLEITGDKPYLGVINAICSSGSKNLTIFEGTV